MRAQSQELQTLGKNRPGPRAKALVWQRWRPPGSHSETGKNGWLPVGTPQNGVQKHVSDRSPNPQGRP